MLKSKLPNFSMFPKNFLAAGLSILTLIVGFFTGSYYTTQKQSQLLTQGTVTRIIDADTIELNNNISVRLNGISYPEKNGVFNLPSSNRVYVCGGVFPRFCPPQIVSG